jgi:hypothetical protein
VPKIQKETFRTNRSYLGLVEERRKTRRYASECGRGSKGRSKKGGEERGDRMGYKCAFSPALDTQVALVETTI